MVGVWGKEMGVGMEDDGSTLLLCRNSCVAQHRAEILGFVRKLRNAATSDEICWRWISCEYAVKQLTTLGRGDCDRMKDHCTACWHKHHGGEGASRQCVHVISNLENNLGDEFLWNRVELGLGETAAMW